MSGKKLFVLDTNVILHDPSCIKKFGDNDVAVPIQVLEELDEFKKGTDTNNVNARDFIRVVDEISEDEMLNGGMSLGENLGKIRILTVDEITDVKKYLDLEKVDNQILNAVKYLHNTEADKEVILVTKDVNLRVKARSLKLKAEDYHADNVPAIDDLYKGIARLSIDSSIEKKLHESTAYGRIAYETNDANLIENQFLILQKGLAMYREHSLFKITKDAVSVFGIKPKNSEQAFALHALLMPDIKLVSLGGRAGTGKTILSLAAALQQKSDYTQIFFTRQTVPMGNREIGYLPGSVNEKLDPYMQALFDNLSAIGEMTRKTDEIAKLKEVDKIVIEPLSFIRGRSLLRKFFIIDEAQNLTPHEVKTIITRAGHGTKMVFIGDVEQIDHPYLSQRSNGFSYMIEKFKGQSMYAHVTLEKGERSDLAELASKLL